jgi:hypothetical protein
MPSDTPFNVISAGSNAKCTNALILSFHSAVIPCRLKASAIAKALGLELSPTVLALADEVIE